MLTSEDFMGKISEKLKTFDYYRLLTYLFVFSLLGWLFETGAVLIEFNHFSYRGFFFAKQTVHYYFPQIANDSFLGQLRLVWGLPMIDMYGYGAIIICYTLEGLKKKPVKLFFIGMILMSLFELIGSYFCSFVLHHDYWDYTDKFMNFQGRICLQSAIAWGVLSFITIRWLKPEVDKSYEKVKEKKWYKNMLIVLLVYFVICSVVKYIVDPGIIPS